MPDVERPNGPVTIEDEMRRSYMDYAMSVIIGRALPDVRDGLKPAHRRVIYGMRTMGLAVSSGPIADDGPVTTLTTPAGMPARSASSARASAE